MQELLLVSFEQSLITFVFKLPHIASLQKVLSGEISGTTKIIHTCKKFLQNTSYCMSKYTARKYHNILVFTNQIAHTGGIHMTPI